MSLATCGPVTVSTSTLETPATMSRSGQGCGHFVEYTDIDSTQGLGIHHLSVTLNVLLIRHTFPPEDAAETTGETTGDVIGRGGADGDPRSDTVLSVWTTPAETWQHQIQLRMPWSSKLTCSAGSSRYAILLMWARCTGTCTSSFSLPNKTVSDAFLDNFHMIKWSQSSCT